MVVRIATPYGSGAYMVANSESGLSYGPELITNGTFPEELGTSGWTPNSGATLSWSSGKLRVDVTVSDTRDKATQAITCVVGRIYLFTFEATVLSGSLGVVVGDNSNAATGNRPITTASPGAYFFIATATTEYIHLGPNGIGVATFDNISVREIIGADRAAVQANSSLRPIHGRAPKRGQVNFMTASNNFSVWSNGASVTGPDAEGFWTLPADGGALTRSVPITSTTDQSLKTVSVLVKADAANGGSFRFVNTNIGTTWTSSYFDTANLVEGAGVELIEEGIYRVSWSATMYGRNGGTLSIGPLSETGKQITFKNFEFARASAPHSDFQTVGVTNYDITEENIPSYGYLRFDGTDDKMTHTFPDGFNGEVIICGRNGSWVETGVSVAAGGTLDIGPKAIGSSPYQVIPALGDIVAWAPVGKTLTEKKRRALVNFYINKGAKGLLVPDGVELLTNGTFDTDTSEWSATGSITLASVSGQGVFTSAQTVAYGYQAATTEAGKLYRITFDYVSSTGGNLYFRVGSAVGLNNLVSLNNNSGYGSREYVFVATSTLSYIHFGCISGASITIDNVSVQRLVPEEEL